MEVGNRNWRLGNGARKILFYGVLPGVMIVSLTVSIGATYAQSYNNKIFPGVSIGPIDVGGLTHEKAAAKLATATNAAIKDGLTVTIDGLTQTIPLLNEGVSDPDTSVELVNWKIDAAVETALAVGRQNSLASIVVPLVVRVNHRTVGLAPNIDQDRLLSELAQAFPQAHQPAVEPAFLIKKINGAWQALVSVGSSGTIVDHEELLAKMEQSLRTELFLPVLSAKTNEQQPRVSQEAAEGLVDEVVTIMQAAPYTLTYADEYGEYEWSLDEEMLASALAPILKNNAAVVGFVSTFSDTMRTLTSDVLTPAQDAKLVIENGKVKEFQTSKAGAELNMDETLAAITAVWGQADQTIELAVTTTAPSVDVGDVNDLGINEILGVGTSNFSGSPTNRIKNIKNGARLLNGTLIKPGETFSLLNTLKPFTTDNGYLPELVIKGDKIQPELGGGLCQIGTTIFRAAMNSGMPIVERRSHSLAVSYYFDPENGTPGTDATIYEPSPDFKFLNDTGYYILIATDVNTINGQLTFTLWGTSDGRQGSYSAPVVSSWISPGETRNIETLDLEPGKIQCQHAYPGANASFTYTIKRSEDEIEEQIFTSSYRALPEICLVGVAELTPTEPTVEDPSSSETTNDPPLME